MPGSYVLHRQTAGTAPDIKRCCVQFLLSGA